MSPSVAVVGAGMGGLSAAVALSARPHWEVTVLEAASRPGGKVGRQSHRGVPFDTGPSLLTVPSVLESLLEDRGYDLRRELTLFRPDPMTRYHFADGTSFDVGSRPKATETNIRQRLGPGAARQFRDFLDYAKSIWDAAVPHFVMGPAPTVLTPVKLGLSALRALRDIDSTNTMAGAIDSRISDPRLRDVFLRYATFHGSDPRRAPATLNCIGWVDLGAGGWGVEGGMYEIVRLLQRVATEGGVTIRCSTPVTSIEPAGNGFEVGFDSGRLEADAIVVNADIRHFADELWADSKPNLKLDAELSTSGWTAVIEARRRPKHQRPAHSVIFPERDYLEEFADLFDRRKTPQQPTIYLCAPEKAHRCEGWRNHEPLFAMINAPAATTDAADTDWDAVEQWVLRRLKRLDIIDDRARVVWRRTPRELKRRFPGSCGSIYGAASNSRLSAFRRPPNRAPDVDGIYLASSSAHPGGGLPLCIQSGRRAAIELLEDYS